MRTKVGVMGSAAPDSARLESGRVLVEKAEQLGNAIAKNDVVLFTGATTGLVYVVGKTAHDAGCFHVGISPGSNRVEHVELYHLPLDACDTIVYTGFGLKGRNVVLVRSCEIVLFIAGAMGTLNEFTIAHDEGKIIGCLTGTGGVADESEFILQKFGKRATAARVFTSSDPNELVDKCLQSI
ncbi:MAG TPA: hypothetical protein VJP89_14335 [Pyrinomonadaceae bacterium]|nr:hypothetical protein [Pyrinomonadaceae bacterium]